MNHTDAKGPGERLDDTTRELAETNRQLCEQILANEQLRAQLAKAQDEITRLREMHQ